LDDKGRKHLRVLAQLSEVSIKHFIGTSLYSKQRLSILSDLFNKAEYLYSELERENNDLERDILILKRNSNFFGSYF
jgi:hypothetical protein